MMRYQLLSIIMDIQTYDEVFPNGLSKYIFVSKKR